MMQTTTELQKNDQIFVAENAKKNPTLIDYKNVTLLKNFITESGRIISGRLSNMPAKLQRKITKAIKIARFLALLPYTDRHKKLNESSSSDLKI